jgi:hypothetical protein
VHDWIAVDGLIFSAVNPEICLTVAIQIKLAQRDTTVDGLLEDSRSHASPVPRHVAGKPSVHRQQVHLRSSPSVTSLSSRLIGQYNGLPRRVKSSSHRRNSDWGKSEAALIAGRVHYGLSYLPVEPLQLAFFNDVPSAEQGTLSFREVQSLAGATLFRRALAYLLTLVSLRS